jgi:hypothetical protein
MLGNHPSFFDPSLQCLSSNQHNQSTQTNHVIKDGQSRRVGMALSPSAGEHLTDWTFLAVVAMAGLSVVECHKNAGPSDVLAVAPHPR